jgi:anti-sigma B factor antagonist
MDRLGIALVGVDEMPGKPCRDYGDGHSLTEQRASSGGLPRGALMFNPYELRVCDGAGRDVRLEISGDIDMAVAPQLLDSVLAAAYSYDEHNVVVLDLTDCTFIDSSGLTALLEADRRIRGRAHLVVINPSQLVARIFVATGLDGLLDIRAGGHRAPDHNLVD